jgi:hypothetical protein
VRPSRLAAARAGLAGVTPYNGRDTFASLLISENRPPFLMAPALGHGDTQALRRHYAGVVAEAEPASGAPIEVVVAQAREVFRPERDVPTSSPRGRSKAPRADCEPSRKALISGEKRVRAAGFEPATSGSGGQRSIH